MANENNKKKGKLSPLTVGIASTAAVAAGVAAVALSSKENRKKAGKMLNDLKSKGADLTKRASDGLDKALKEEQKVRNTVEKISKKAKNGTANVRRSVKLRTKTTARSRSAKSGSTGSKSAARSASI